MVREEIAVKDWETIEHVEKVEQSEKECVIGGGGGKEVVASWHAKVKVDLTKFEFEVASPLSDLRPPYNASSDCS